MAFVYGIHAVDSLLRRNPEQVQQLWLQSGRNDKRVGALETLARNQGVAIVRAKRQRLDDMVNGRHQGAVAETVGEAASTESEGANLWSESQLFEHVVATLAAADKSLLILVLDGVTDPQNLGACLRSADAAGVDAVVVPKDKAAGLTPVVHKVACGAAEAVPFVQVTNLARTLQGLKERGVWLFGTTGDADKSIYDSDLAGPLALVLGAEGSGMRRLTRENCDVLVRLPMAGSVSSLNVSVAAGICLFEAVRQRSTAS